MTAGSFERAWLDSWASRFGADAKQGECGFGRPCVGIQIGSQWVQRVHYDADFRESPPGLGSQDGPPPAGVETFSKSALLVVMLPDIAGLGGEELSTAWDGLARWCLTLEQAGIGIRVVRKQVMDVSAMLGERTEPILARIPERP